MSFDSRDGRDGQEPAFTAFTAPAVTECSDRAIQEDFLLLAWGLTLLRYNNGTPVRFAWGCGNPDESLSTSQIVTEISAPLSNALNAVSVLRKDLRGDSTKADTLVFRDQDAPENSRSEVQSPHWNIQLEVKIASPSLLRRSSWRHPLGASYIARRYAQTAIEIAHALSDLSQPISTVLNLGEADLVEIWQWNKDVPPVTDTCTHDLITEQARKQPHAQAIHSWDGDLSYGEVEEYADLLAQHLLSIGYDPDGERGFVFVGRKDTQVKLRGQRVELGEIEHHLRIHLPGLVRVAAEVIAPQGQKNGSMLVAFIAEPVLEGDRQVQHTNDEIRQAVFSSNLSSTVGALSENLSKALPIYMVPSAYIAIDRMPMLVSGKTDRKLLRALGSKLALQTSRPHNGSETPIAPKTVQEKTLQGLWAKILGIPVESVGPSHDFFVLGGDSVLAMRLIPATRAARYNLTVADVFNYPQLSRMAGSMKPVDPEGQADVPPLSLIGPGWDVQAALHEVSQICGVSATVIEDIYPCTPLQEILMAFSVRSEENYIAQRIAEIPSIEAAAKLKSAWNEATQECPILRTRIADIRDRGLMQVVVKDEAAWSDGESLDAFLSRDRNQKMAINVPLSRYAIVTDQETGKIYFIWTVHHAIYDGWSTDLIIDRVRKAYEGMPAHRAASMRHFIRYLTDPARETSREYWRNQLHGATGPQYPSLPSRTYLPKPDAMAELYVQLPRPGQASITTATIVRAAWALVASQYTSSDDVVFAEILTGRNLPLSGVEDIEGPMITTVPVRIRVDRTVVIEDYLHTIQEQGLARIPHEHLGMQNIRRVSSDAQLACEFKMGLVIQPGDGGNYVEDGMPAFESVDAAREALHFNSYPLMLACTLQPDGFKVLASFDPNLIDVKQMERVLAQLQRCAQQLSSNLAAHVGSINSLDDSSTSQLRNWSQSIANSLSIGDRFPKVGGSWIVSPDNVGQLTPIGASGELVVEVNAPQGVEGPAWMIRGSNYSPWKRDRILVTGVLVKYDDTGCLIFMGHKTARVSMQGHLADLAMVEGQLRRVLPSVTEVAAFVVPPGTLVAAVKEEQVPTAISSDLADSLLGVNKSLVDLLPPYMIPSVYVPVCHLDAARDPEVANEITPSFLLQCRAVLADIKAGRAPKATKNVKERVLRKFWAKILGVDEVTIESDDSFFRLGGDSIMAMKLASALRQAGYILSVAGIFRSMRLRDMANLMVDADSPGSVKPEYKPFSTLHADSIQFLEKSVKGHLQDPSWEIEDVLSLTDPQSRDNRIDKARLAKSCQDLVSIHPILRTVFVANGETYLQVVVKHLDVQTVELDCAEGQNIEAFCKQIAVDDVETGTPLGSPFLKFFFINGTKENALMLRISHAQYDGISFPELIRHLELLYSSKLIPQTAPFSHFIQHSTGLKEESIKYWRRGLQGSRLSILASDSPSTNPKPIFIKRCLGSPPEPREATLANILTAAWAVLLFRTLKTDDITFAGVVSGRHDSGMEATMGPCYQYIPIRVQMIPDWTANDLLTSVRDQYLDGARYASLGFKGISDNCTSWSPMLDFFDSIVHHQDVEYFDSIPFGDGTCRIDYTNPHPEPAKPTRVVSYVEGGRLWYGIATSEGEKDLYEKLLSELCEVVMFMNNRGGLMLDELIGRPAR
ncbi:CoA-dependent acyltransferase [Aspergillus ellipticus CBS 707.79]|uniref:CoA-dependent acyltransferase n=1 Tax=Aspergillus ellipticus CBS 707.79 TaxID=1448320 RepID=A0A319DA59_9EURO|nr:CoA-dependent acyltransferase [Aspergillus ellipticus CBS 707.79]